MSRGWVRVCDGAHSLIVTNKILSRRRAVAEVGAISVDEGLSKETGDGSCAAVPAEQEINSRMS